jgi:D-tyrosyl-tRNA(Tyr) deacylase
MKVVLQRVSRARVEVDSQTVGQIADGLLVLLGITHADTEQDADTLVEKITKLRIFEDGDGAMNDCYSRHSRRTARGVAVHAVCRLQKRESPELW